MITKLHWWLKIQFGFKSLVSYNHSICLVYINGKFDGAIGAKTELQELTASLKQGFAQMSAQDWSKTIAESISNCSQSELEIQYEDMESVDQEETPQAKHGHEVNGEPAAKRKKDTKTTCLWEAVTKLTDSAGAQKTPSNEGKFDVLNSLKQGQERGNGSKY